MDIISKIDNISPKKTPKMMWFIKNSYQVRNSDSKLKLLFLGYILLGGWVISKHWVKANIKLPWPVKLNQMANTLSFFQTWYRGSAGCFIPFQTDTVAFLPVYEGKHPDWEGWTQF